MGQKEIWVKVVAYKRHLVDESVLSQAEVILSGDSNAGNDYEIFINHLDANVKEEFDNVGPFINADQKLTYHVSEVCPL
jgi:hypothetical protein